MLFQIKGLICHMWQSSRGEYIVSSGLPSRGENTGHLASISETGWWAKTSKTTPSWAIIFPRRCGQRSYLLSCEVPVLLVRQLPACDCKGKLMLTTFRSAFSLLAPFSDEIWDAYFKNIRWSNETFWSLPFDLRPVLPTTLAFLKTKLDIGQNRQS